MNYRKLILGGAIAIGLVGAGTVGGYALNNNLTNTQTAHYAKPTETSYSKSKTTDKTPSQSLANSVMTSSVKKQLGNNITYNGNGAFIINDNKTDLDASITSAPWANNTTDTVQYKGQTLVRPKVGNAWLNSTTYQSASRESTNQGRTNWTPTGWHQLKLTNSSYNHAVERGHLLGYALIGNLKGFDASESNPANVATQTAWANQGGSENSTGQKFYEVKVIKAIKSHKNVRYRVTDVYDGNNLVPSGAHIEAKSSDGSLQFNVFVPNVQSGLKLDYATGVTIHG